MWTCTKEKGQCEWSRRVIIAPFIVCIGNAIFWSDFAHANCTMQETVVTFIESINYRPCKGTKGRNKRGKSADPRARPSHVKPINNRRRSIFNYTFRHTRKDETLLRKLDLPLNICMYVCAYVCTYVCTPEDVSFNNVSLKNFRFI